MTSRPHDLLVLGATGVSGRLLAERLRARAPGELRWALAGRDQTRLETLRAELGVPEVGLEIVDVTKGKDLRRVLARTRAVVNTVGPYLRTGLAIVEACVDAGTHYCDLAGELPFMQRSADAFHERARARGLRIVHACGYDCVPSDLGLLWLQGELTRAGYEPARRVTTYVMSLRGAMSGGSAASLVVQGELSAQERERAAAPRALDPDPEARGGRPAEADALGPVYAEAIAAWTAPFFMVPINTRVVRRSEALLGRPWGEDFVYAEAMVGGAGLPGRLKAGAYLWGMRLLLALTRRRWGRALLSRALPRPGEGPSRASIEAGHFRHLVVPELADGSRPLLARVEGDSDPGYGETSRMLCECALALIDPQLDTPAGVITPAVAFGLPLVDALRRAGMCWTLEPATPSADRR